MPALGSLTHPLDDGSTGPRPTVADEPILTVTVEPEGASARLRLDGPLDLATVPTFRSCLDQLDSGFRTVLVDLAGVTFIDSTGLGSLVTARRAFESELRTLLFCNPSERARFVFELAALSDLITN